MKVKKYLISIQGPGEKRYEQFFSQDGFDEIEFIKYGVIGKNLSTSEYFNLAVKNKIRTLTPSELGCTLSHLSALRDFVDSDADYAYIFEDDVVAKKEIDFNLDLDILRDNFILSLGGVNQSVCHKIRGKILNEEYMGEKILKVSPLYYEDIVYAMGYLLDKEAARKIILCHEVNLHVIDHWHIVLNTYPELSYYMVNLLDHPEVLSLNTENSSICDERNGHFLYDFKPKLFNFVLKFIRYRLYKLKKRIGRLYYEKHKF